MHDKNELKEIYIEMVKRTGLLRKCTQQSILNSEHFTEYVGTREEEGW